METARARYERRVRELAAMGHRGSTTDREAQAAAYLMDELRGGGLEAETEGFAGSGSLGARLLLHVGLATLAAPLLWIEPLIPLVVGLVALTSLVAEQSTRFLLLGKFLVTRPSRNVVAAIEAPGGTPKRRLVVLAHYDTQRTGLIWREGLVRRTGPLLWRSPPFLKSPLAPVMLAMAALPAAALAQLVSPSGAVAWGVGIPILVVLVVASLLLLEWSRGPYVPGAADNASGTAAVLTIAERWHDDPIADVELVALCTGCEETGLLGAAAWADAHAQQWRTTPTRFVNIDTLGYGRPRFIGGEHSLAGVPVRYREQEIALCAAVAAEREMTDAGPHLLPVATDGLALLVRGIPGASILSFEDGGHMPNYHQLSDTADRMDFDIAWDGVELAWAVARRLAREWPE